MLTERHGGHLGGLEHVNTTNSISSLPRRSWNTNELAELRAITIEARRPLRNQKRSAKGKKAVTQSLTRCFNCIVEWTPHQVEGTFRSDEFFRAFCYVDPINAAGGSLHARPPIRLSLSDASKWWANYFNSLFSNSHLITLITNRKHTNAPEWSHLDLWPLCLNLKRFVEKPSVL